MLERPTTNIPYLEMTDTSRVNLSGLWPISLGAEHGQMEIRQDEKNRIQGNYVLEDERKGQVDGFKDGTSFRVFFQWSQPGVEKLRIEASFKINELDKRYIEMEGCAYGLAKDNNVKMDAGGKDKSCKDVRDYVGWKGVTVTSFYATAQLRQ